MKPVPTAAGSVEASQLGTTLMHEHIFVLSPEINQNYPETLGAEAERIEQAVSELGLLKAGGIDSLVDLTVLGLGRDVRRIQRIASRIPVNILVATGLYTFDDLPMYFRFRSPDALLEMFLRDIEAGIAGTGVRAAVLKCATDVQGVTPGVECVLRCAARAHRKTGIPICTHAHAGTRRGLDQLRIFMEEGVDPAKVVIGHCGDSRDFDYLGQILETGAFLGMDRFGMDNILPFEARVDTVARLCRLGHAGRMVLSHDAACYQDWFPKVLSRAVPNWHFLHIRNDVIPALVARGVPEGDIRAMLVENPRRIFS